MRISLLILVFGLITPPVLSQSTWAVPKRDREIVVDGNLQEWAGVTPLTLSPEVNGLQRGGTFHDQDVDLQIRAMWDEDSLYLALNWTDDVWDVQEVTRRDAVWIDSQKKRRDKMYFFDYFKFHLRDADYDYTLWLSPQNKDQGPFEWCRLLEGYRGLERATASPSISARQDNGRSTIEMLLSWDELRLKPSDIQKIPLTLIVSDSDDPGRLIESKLEKVKWLAWRGFMDLEGEK